VQIKYPTKTTIYNLQSTIYNLQSKVDTQNSAIDFNANSLGIVTKPSVKIASWVKAAETGVKLAQYWPAICAGVGLVGTAWQYHDDLANIISGASVQSKKDLTRFVRQILSSPVASTMPEDWQKSMKNYVMKSDDLQDAKDKLNEVFENKDGLRERDRDAYDAKIAELREIIERLTPKNRK
jgi:hypothetical protein